MAKQVPLGKLLKAIDLKDRDFYDELDAEEKKSFSGYIAMRWASSATSNPSIPGVEGYYIQSANANANKDMFNLSKHPKLQWLVVTTISPGMGTMSHQFLKHKPKANAGNNKIRKQLSELYPEMKDDDLDTLAKMTTQKELTSYNKSCGNGK